MKSLRSFVVGLLIPPGVAAMVVGYVTWHAPQKSEARSMEAMRQAKARTATLVERNGGRYPEAKVWEREVGAPGVRVNTALAGRRRQDLIQSERIIELSETVANGRLVTVTGEIVRPDLRAALDYRWRP